MKVNNDSYLTNVTNFKDENELCLLQKEIEPIKSLSKLLCTHSSAPIGQKICNCFNMAGDRLGLFSSLSKLKETNNGVKLSENSLKSLEMSCVTSNPIININPNIEKDAKRLYTILSNSLKLSHDNYSVINNINSCSIAGLNNLSANSLSSNNNQSYTTNLLNSNLTSINTMSFSHLKIKPISYSRGLTKKDFGILSTNLSNVKTLNLPSSIMQSNLLTTVSETYLLPSSVANNISENFKLMSPLNDFKNIYTNEEMPINFMDNGDISNFIELNNSNLVDQYADKNASVPLINSSVLNDLTTNNNICINKLSSTCSSSINLSDLSTINLADLSKISPSLTDLDSSTSVIWSTDSLRRSPIIPNTSLNFIEPYFNSNYLSPKISSLLNSTNAIVTLTSSDSKSEDALKTYDSINTINYQEFKSLLENYDDEKISTKDEVESAYIVKSYNDNICNSDHELIYYDEINYNNTCESNLHTLSKEPSFDSRSEFKLDITVNNKIKPENKSGTSKLLEIQSKQDNATLITNNLKLPNDHSIHIQKFNQPNEIIFANTKDKIANVSMDDDYENKIIMTDVPISTNIDHISSILCAKKDDVKKSKSRSSRPDFSEIGSGLHNLGNTCFVNATLQCLSYTPLLRDYLLLEQRSLSSCNMEGCCIMCELGKHVSDCFNSGGRIIKPHSVLQKLKVIARHMKWGRQEDAHEFLRYLIDAMNKSCLSGHQKFLSNGLSNERRTQTLVNSIFGGLLRSQVSCEICGYRSDTFDAFLDMSVDVKDTQSITEALNRFVTPETLEQENSYFCTKCEKNVRAKKRLTIHQPSRILTIQLKRYGVAGGKVTRHIKFSETLDLRPFISQTETEQNPEYLLTDTDTKNLSSDDAFSDHVVEKNRNTLKLSTPIMSECTDLLYNLYAVLVHDGHSTSSGHYYCYVKTKKGQWYCMNDHMVNKSNISDVLTSEAYLLFYCRQFANEIDIFDFCKSMGDQHHILIPSLGTGNCKAPSFLPGTQRNSACRGGQLQIQNTKFLNKRRKNLNNKSHYRTSSDKISSLQKSIPTNRPFKKPQKPNNIYSTNQKSIIRNLRRNSLLKINYENTKELKKDCENLPSLKIDFRTKQNMMNIDSVELGIKDNNMFCKYSTEDFKDPSCNLYANLSETDKNILSNAITYCGNNSKNTKLSDKSFINPKKLELLSNSIDHKSGITSFNFMTGGVQSLSFPKTNSIKPEYNVQKLTGISSLGKVQITNLETKLITSPNRNQLSFISHLSSTEHDKIKGKYITTAINNNVCSIKNRSNFKDAIKANVKLKSNNLNRVFIESIEKPESNKRLQLLEGLIFKPLAANTPRIPRVNIQENINFSSSEVDNGNSVCSINNQNVILHSNNLEFSNLENLNLPAFNYQKFNNDDDAISNGSINGFKSTNKFNESCCSNDENNIEVNVNELKMNNKTTCNYNTLNIYKDISYDNKDNDDEFKTMPSNTSILGDEVSKEINDLYQMKDLYHSKDVNLINDSCKSGNKIYKRTRKDSFNDRKVKSRKKRLRFDINSNFPSQKLSSAENFIPQSKKLNICVNDNFKCIDVDTNILSEINNDNKNDEGDELSFVNTIKSNFLNKQLDTKNKQKHNCIDSLSGNLKSITNGLFESHDPYLRLDYRNPIEKEICISVAPIKLRKSGRTEGGIQLYQIINRT